MKKTIILISALALMLILTACGETEYLPSNEQDESPEPLVTTAFITTTQTPIQSEEPITTTQILSQETTITTPLDTIITRPKPQVTGRVATQGYRLIEYDVQHFNNARETKKRVSFEIPNDSATNDNRVITLQAAEEISLLSTSIGWGHITVGTRDDILNNTHEYRDSTERYIDYHAPDIYTTQYFEVFRYICVDNQLYVYHLYSNGEYFTFYSYNYYDERTLAHDDFFKRIAESVRF